VAIIFLLLSPIVAGLMQAAVSRRRESMADVMAVKLTRYPPGLISALEKLRDDQTVVGTASRATAHLWIESPLARNKDEGSLSWLNNLYDTHPPLDQRIDTLRHL
jgi:heat shock protein HtpX